MYLSPYDVAFMYMYFKHMSTHKWTGGGVVSDHATYLATSPDSLCLAFDIISHIKTDSFMSTFQYFYTFNNVLLFFVELH